MPSAVGGMCPQDLTSGAYGTYTWPSTGGGSIANQSCQYGSTASQEDSTASQEGSGGDLGEFGFELAQRVCNTTGNWEEPSFNGCQSGELT